MAMKDYMNFKGLVPWKLADQLKELGMEMPLIPVGYVYLVDDVESDEGLERKWLQPTYASVIEFLSQVFNIFVTISFEEDISSIQEKICFSTKALKVREDGYVLAKTEFKFFESWEDAANRGIEEGIKIAKNLI